MSFDFNKTMIIDSKFLYGKNNQLFIKEISFYTATCVQTFHVKCPKTREPVEDHIVQTNRYLTCNLGTPPWRFGDVTLGRLKVIVSQFITRKAEYFICKGKEKSQVLQRLLNITIQDLEEYNMPSLKSLPENNVYCYYHDIGTRCSLNDCVKLYLFLTTHVLIQENLGIETVF